MTLNKRDFMKLGAASAAGLALGGNAVASMAPTGELKDITRDAKPITALERLVRIRKAQELLAEHGLDAIMLEPGSAMIYFSGVRWWRSERLTTVIIPREGNIGVVTPFFEKPSVEESLDIPAEVIPWHEHESPASKVDMFLKSRGIERGTVGLEDTVRYFVVEDMKRNAPDYTIGAALPVTLGCRMYKDRHELQLMRTANEVTLSAYNHVWTNLEAGMTPADVKKLMLDAQAGFGGRGAWAMALFGEASAYPHGTSQPQTLSEGQIVLMDCGCNVHGYQSDISRTFVFGEATKRQREVWNQVRRGQQVAFEAAQVGVAAGVVDDAVRVYYESLGYGPDYQVPGLSHRTGHGIGMDGHEAVNFVRGEKTPLAKGMCFSNEPGLYDFSAFGVRLEDCLYMTDSGAAWFTEPPVSIDDPIGRMGPAIA